MKILILVMMLVLASASCVSDSDVSNKEVQSRRIQALIKDFESGWEDNKAKLAREEIIKIGRPAVPYLGASLDHANREVRWIATITLGAIGGKEVLAPLEKALSDSDKDVRRYAVGYLGSLFPENGQVMTGIKAMLRDEHPQVVLMAMLYLDGSGETAYKKDRELVEKLVADLKNPDEVVRQYAARALGKIGNEETAIPLAWAFCDPDINFSTRGAMANALSEIQSLEVVPILLGAVKSNTKARFMAANVLRALSAPKANPTLLKLTLSSDKLQAMSAVIALGFEGNKQAVGRLCAIAKDSPDHDLQEKAVEALGRIGDPAAIRLLGKILGDEDDDVRIKSAVALGQIGSSKAVPALTKALDDLNVYVVMHSAYALAKIGDKSAAKDIVALFDRKDARQSSMSSSPLFADIATAADFALERMFESESETHPVLCSSGQYKLNIIRRIWRHRLCLPEIELTPSTKIAQLAENLRLVLLVPGKGYYNLLHILHEGTSDSVIRKSLLPHHEIFTVARILSDESLFEWQHLSLISPFKADEVCLIVFGDDPAGGNSFQCSIGTGEDAAEILEELIEALSGEAKSTIEEVVEFVRDADK